MAVDATVRPELRPSSWGRIRGVMLRQMYLYKRTLHRWLEAVYWPLLDITLWGFLSLYLANRPATSTIAKALLGAILLWDILFRAQQSVSVGFLEDMWSRNVLNVWSTPIRSWEYVAGTILVGVLRVAVGSGLAILVAASFFHLSLFSAVGVSAYLFIVALALMGWSVGVFTTAMILRLGQGAEELAWALAFLFQPFSAVFYPVSALPGWMRGIAAGVPASHIFEGLRAIVLRHSGVPWRQLELAFAIDVVYVLVAWRVFAWALRAVRERGLLSRFGE